MSNLNANTPGNNDYIDQPNSPKTPPSIQQSPSIQERHHNFLNNQDNVNRRLFSSPIQPLNEQHDSPGTHSRLEDLITNLTRRVDILECSNRMLRNELNLLRTRIPSA